MSWVLFWRVSPKKTMKERKKKKANVQLKKLDKERDDLKEAG